MMERKRSQTPDPSKKREGSATRPLKINNQSKMPTLKTKNVSVGHPKIQRLRHPPGGYLGSKPFGCESALEIFSWASTALRMAPIHLIRGWWEYGGVRPSSSMLVWFDPDLE